MSGTDKYKKSDRPIIFGIDTNYVQHVIVAIASLFENNKFDFDVIVLHDGISKAQHRAFAELCKRYRRNIELVEIDGNAFVNYQISNHVTQATYFRFLIPEICKNKYKTAIYFDADIVVIGDISVLFEMDLQGFDLAAVPHPVIGAIKRLIDSNSMYFDAGLLLFDIEEWNRKNIVQAIQNEIFNRKLDCHDNDALNIVFDGNYLEISPIYSLQSNYITNSDIDLSYFKKFGEIDTILRYPVVIQYAGGAKPWHCNSKDYYKDYYWKYLRFTPYKNARCIDTRPNLPKRVLVKARSVVKNIWTMLKK